MAYDSNNIFARILRGEIPWAGICASVGVALVMVWLSLLIIERRDY